MAAHPGDTKKGLRQKAAGWLYRTASTPGWRRRLVLAAAVAVFVVALIMLCSRTDYRQDPSALIPRTVSAYLETRDLETTLANVGGWRLWTEERRENPNQLRIDIAGFIGNLVQGLGTRQPLAWLNGAERAAFAYNDGDATGGRSWALYIEVAAPELVVKEFSVEPDLRVTQLDGPEVFSLSGKGGGTLYFSVVAPWLVISSDAMLPTFALSSVRKPAFSLAGSGVLPKWRRGVAVRGMCAPAMRAESVFTFPFALPGGWVSPEARVTFTSRLGKDGGADTYFLTKSLSEEVDRGGGRVVLFFLLAVVGLLSLAVIVAILLAIVGWGGWLKAMAMRSGATPAEAPAEVEPSPAFLADSGAGQAEAADAVEEEAEKDDVEVISVETTPETAATEEEV